MAGVARRSDVAGVTRRSDVCDITRSDHPSSPFSVLRVISYRRMDLQLQRTLLQSIPDVLLMSEAKPSAALGDPPDPSRTTQASSTQPRTRLAKPRPRMTESPETSISVGCPAAAKGSPALANPELPSRTSRQLTPGGIIMGGCIQGSRMPRS